MNPFCNLLLRLSPGLVLMLTACSTTSNTVIGYESDTQIMIEDPVTEKRVAIAQVSDHRENNLLHAVVTLENLTSRNIRVQYRFQWYNEDGVLVMPSSDVYKTLLMEGRETVPVQSIAPRQDVVKYRFNVTELNKRERGPNSF